jgi:5'-3' exonuclease
MNVLLLDAYNLIYRAKSGFTKGDYYVVYNFFRGLRPLIEKFDPDKVYFVLEGAPEFRKKLNENYKANRNSSDQNFHNQKAQIISIIKQCFPITTARHPHLECDDTIATLVKVHHDKGDNCTIISSDSDFYQLLNHFSNCQIYNPVRKKMIDTPLYDYVTWKALRGDATDNISGIPGCGDKTATKLVTGHPKALLDYLYAKPDRQNIFERNVNLIRLVDFSNDLGDLETNVGISNWEEVYNLFYDMGFSTMIKEKTWNNYIKTFQKLK